MDDALLTSTCSLLSSTYHLLSSTCSLLSLTRHLLSSICSLLSSTYHLLSSTYQLLSSTCSLLSSTDGLLSSTCSLLLMARKRVKRYEILYIVTLLLFYKTPSYHTFNHYTILGISYMIHWFLEFLLLESLC